MRVLIVDDELLACERIRTLLAGQSAIEITGECHDGRTAVALIATLLPDLVFLDVQMPGMDGFGVIKNLSAKKLQVPRIIFATAHDKHALRAFEVHAFDYLLKPFNEDRFREALRRVREEQAQSSDSHVSRLREMLEEMQRERGFPERILIHEDSRAFFVSVREISWVEAERNYVTLHCARKKLTLRGTLDSLEDTLDPKLFVRVNRGSLVRLEAIRELLPWFHGEYKVILHDNTELRWSRRYVTQRPELLKIP